jgi:hypothetical protein
MQWDQADRKLMNEALKEARTSSSPPEEMYYSENPAKLDAIEMHK